MLYRLTSVADLSKLPSNLTPSLKEEIATSLELLDREYGGSKESGACVLLVEIAEDLTAVKDIINIDAHPCEWAEYVGKDRDYVVVVYQINNDYGIDLYLPLSITPDNIKEEL